MVTRRTALRRVIGVGVKLVKMPGDAGGDRVCASEVDRVE
jgi:hypothetical protein